MDGAYEAWPFFDLDMLETSYYNAAFLSADRRRAACGIFHPGIYNVTCQLSCDLSKLTQFDRDMFCNDEIIALNQDVTGILQTKMVETKAGTCRTRIYTRPLADGGIAAAFFNMREETADMTLSLDGAYHIRDLWAKENLDDINGVLTLTLEPHTVRIVKLNKN